MVLVIVCPVMIVTTGGTVVVARALLAMAVSAHHEKVAGKHEHDEDGEGDPGAYAQCGQEEDKGDRDEAPEDVQKSMFHCAVDFEVWENRGTKAGTCSR